MNDDFREMIIRHDEQLKSLSTLPDAVNELTAQLRVANAKTTTVAACIGVIGSILGCAGTWVVMIKFAH